MNRLDNDWQRIDSSLQNLAKGTETTIRDMETGAMKATAEELAFMKAQLTRLNKAYRLIFNAPKRRTKKGAL